MGFGSMGSLGLNPLGSVGFGSMGSLGLDPQQGRTLVDRLDGVEQSALFPLEGRHPLAAVGDRSAQAFEVFGGLRSARACRERKGQGEERHAECRPRGPPAFTETAAKPGEDQEACQDDGQGVDRVGQEQGQPVDEGYLDEHETKADGAEVAEHPPPPRRSQRRPPTEAQGEEDQDCAGDEGLEQGRQQYRVAELQQTNTAQGAQREQLGQRLPGEIARKRA